MPTIQQHIQQHKFAYVIIGLSLLTRLFAGYFHGLEVHEAYYMTYAKYLQWSYNDHPGMTGWLLHTFTFGLRLDAEVAIRTMSLLFGTVNLVLIYRIALEIFGKRAAQLALLIFASSLYNTVYGGLLASVDAPLTFFWTLGIFYGMRFIRGQRGADLLLFSFAVGCATLSKYSGITLWFGMFMYALLSNRRLFRIPSFYVGMGLTAAMLLPILLWNQFNPSSSFAFHANRYDVESFQTILHRLEISLVPMISLFNPIHVLVVAALFGRFFSSTSPHIKFLLWSAIPSLIVYFVGMPFINISLPHWLGPAMISLGLATAPELVDRWNFLGKFYTAMFILASTFLVLSVPLVDRWQYNHLSMGDQYRLMDRDVWTQLEDEIEELAADTPFTIATQSWQTAGFFEHYLTPNELFANEVKVIGSAFDNSNYYYVQLGKPLPAGTNMLYLTTDWRGQKPPRSLRSKFTSHAPCDTIAITHEDQEVLRFYTFRYYDLREDLDLTPNH